MENNTTIDISLNEAKEWYNSGNETLKELALKCFPLRKLNTHKFENIKTFEDAVNELGKDIEHANFIVNVLEHLSRYFGMLITEAKFGDLDGFEIIERKY